MRHVLLLLLPSLLLAHQACRAGAGMGAGSRPPSQLLGSWNRAHPAFPNVTCPCSPQYCRALRTPLPKKEVHIYHVGYVGDDREWKHYDWSQLTTICIFGHEGYIENPLGYAPLLCHAHQHGVRVTFGGGLINEPGWGNKTTMAATVDQKLAELRAWGFDGINIDIEQAMQNESQAARLLDTVVTVVGGLKAEMPWLLASFAVAHLGSEVDRTAAAHWPMRGLAEALDFLVVMDYDASNVKAGGNLTGHESKATMALPFMKSSVATYASMGVPASKLVLALPFFGVDWQCDHATKQPAGQPCALVLSGNSGMAWDLTPGACELSCDFRAQGPGKAPTKLPSCLSQAHGSYWRYPGCTVCPAKPDNYVCGCKNNCPTAHFCASGACGGHVAWHWDNWSSTPYYTYTDHYKLRHEVWIDNPKSLSLKFGYAAEAGARGVGVWSAGLLDYNKTSEAAQFWEAFKSFGAGMRSFSPSRAAML